MVACLAGLGVNGCSAGGSTECSLHEPCVYCTVPSV